MGKYHHGFLIKSNMWGTGKGTAGRVYFGSGLSLKWHCSHSSKLMKGQNDPKCSVVGALLCMEQECRLHLYAYCSVQIIWFPETPGFFRQLIEARIYISSWRPFDTGARQLAWQKTLNCNEFEWDNVWICKRTQTAIGKRYQCNYTNFRLALLLPPEVEKQFSTSASFSLTL